MNQIYLVLLVEDNPDQADLVIEYLRITSSYQVVWARDKSSFWEIYPQQPFDVILMDYRLPDGTGLDLLREMTEKGCDTPVIMVTGQGDEQVAAQTIQSGASDYIVKKPDYVFLLSPVIQKTIQNSRLQKEIRQSLAKIRYQSVILNNIHDAVVAWDLKGKVTFWNDAATQLFGINIEESCSRFVQDFYFSMFGTNDLMRGLTTKESDLVQDRQIKTKDGVLRWINSKTTKIFDDKNPEQLLGFLEVSRDITERKNMESKIKAAQSQLIESARFAAIGELASGVAHRIFNPLASVMANSQLILQKMGKGDDLYDVIYDILKSGQQAQSIVKQLMDFSKPGTAVVEPISVSNTLKFAINLVGAQIESRGISINICLSNEKSDFILGNRRQIEDLWVNLLIFAGDASFPLNIEKKIFIHSFSYEDRNIVEIMDNGNPIRDVTVQYLFEPNLIESNIERGSGLELSICRGIIQQHRGKINVTSNLQGTTLRVELPAMTSKSAVKE